MTPVGIDIAKETLEVSTPSQTIRIPRTPEKVARLMRDLPADSLIAIEATGRYHRIVVEAAAAADRQIRLVDPHGFSHYRTSLNPRAKNDRLDAKALRRFAEKEGDRLRPARPSSKDMQRLKDLLELRETQVRLRTAWSASLSEQTQVPMGAKRTLEWMNKSILELDRQIEAIAKKSELYKRLREIDGVGPCLAPALVWLFCEKSFENSDQAVAFAGLDVAVRQSGKFEGKRKLTKRGPAFIRRLLYCGCNSLRRLQAFKELFRIQHAKGLRTKGANVVVSRKLLRTAYNLVSHPEWRYDRAKIVQTT